MCYYYGMVLDVAIIKSYVGPDRAKLIDSSDAPFFPDKEIHIEYRGIPRTALKDCLDILGDKCWGTQFTSAAIAYTVTNPVVGTVQFTGLFRNVMGSIKAVEEPRDEVRHDEPRYKILQTLRQGWATAINMDEARLTGNGVYEDLPKEAILVFPNISGQGVAALTATAKGTFTEGKFTLRGEPVAGVWYLHRTRYRHADDGSGVIELKYSQEPETVDKTISRTAFEATVETLTHDDDPLTAKTDLDTKMAAANGTVKSGEIHQDNDNIWICVTRVTTGTKVASVIERTIINALERSATVEDRNAAAGDAVPTPTLPLVNTQVAGQSITITLEKTQFPATLNKSKQITEAIAVDSGWVTFPGRYGNNKTRALENTTLTAIAAAIVDTTTGFDVSCRLTATQYYQRWSAYLHATIIYDNPPQSDWTDFHEEDTDQYKHYIVGDKAYKVKCDWGIKQTQSHAAAKAYVHGNGNPKVSSINGGRHFRATYLTITGQPSLI